MENLNSILEDLKDLNKRLQKAETFIEVSDATRVERHQSMLDRFERVDERLNALEKQICSDMEKLYLKIDALQELATQGKTSLRTLWILGSIVAGGMALLASWLEMFK
jgi:protein subunit release factor A